MNRRILRTFIALTGLAVCIALLCSCGGKDNNGGDGIIDPLPTAEAKNYPALSIPYGDTISTAANLANKVNGYFDSPLRGRYILENTNMKLTYNLSGTDNSFYGLERLENLSGGVFLENTMDTYVRMTDGNTYFASGNTARANLYDQGYYYYDLRVLDQVFGVMDDNAYERKSVLETNDYYAVSMMENPVFNSDGSITLTVKDSYDPYICFRVPESKYKCSEYDAFSVTIKSNRSSEAQLFYTEAGDSDFTSSKFFTFKLIADGEFHTYTIFYDNSVISDHLKAFRLDVGAAAGEVVEVKEFALVKMKSDLPCFKLDRNYNVYSDKVNECIRLVAYDVCETLAAVGTITKIPVDRVGTFVVGDANGNHTDLSEVDWATAAYAGFDIKDAGVFGYILGSDTDHSGSLYISVEDGNYVIRQELDRSGKRVRRGAEVNMARRLYTSSSHDVNLFLQEAFAERNPLEITVDADNSRKKAAYLGYDDLTGAYILRIPGAGDFNVGYENPLTEYKVCFTMSPSVAERTVYLRGYITTDGCIESAVVLDENNSLLPLKVEVCKNFAKDGEELFYTDNDGHSYGLAVFPAVQSSTEPTTFTLCALYEQWGNYRLKQVSSIRFHTAYYHMSLGVTETNCINLYSTEGRLPDHRGLSTIYWADEMLDIVDADGNPTGAKRIYNNQPQHCNVGNHTFLQYTDASGTFVTYENCGATQIDSSGPTLCDLTLNYLSTDGKVYQTYRHVEMPQTDENRTYYEVEYTFLGDVTIKDIASDFSLYAVEFPYDYLGYLNSDNQSVITSTSKTSVTTYKLGTEKPYFDMFHKTVRNTAAYTEEAASCNVSFLLDTYDITIGGKEYTGGFVVREGGGKAIFNFDLSGRFTFKRGDTIKLRFIIMPWGDYRSVDDANVRMVRVNTLLNPIVAEALSGSTVSEDNIVPTIRSGNGSDCEFTISGGYPNVRDLPGYATAEYTKYKSVWERDYNITVKAGGFSKLCVPVISELIDGEWERYEIASSLGYDGYTVEYEADGTFTYSFVVTMTEAKARTFRVEAG